MGALGRGASASLRPSVRRRSRAARVLMAGTAANAGVLFWLRRAPAFSWDGESSSDHQHPPCSRAATASARHSTTALVELHSTAQHYSGSSHWVGHHFCHCLVAEGSVRVRSCVRGQRNRRAMQRCLLQRSLVCFFIACQSVHRTHREHPGREMVRARTGAAAWTHLASTAFWLYACATTFR